MFSGQQVYTFCSIYLRRRFAFRLGIAKQFIVQPKNKPREMEVTKSCFIPPAWCLGERVKMLWAKKRNTISLRCVPTTALSWVVNNTLFAVFEIIQVSGRKK